MRSRKVAVSALPSAHPQVPVWVRTTGGFSSSPRAPAAVPAAGCIYGRADVLPRRAGSICTCQSPLRKLSCPRERVPPGSPTAFGHSWVRDVTPPPSESAARGLSLSTVAWDGRAETCFSFPPAAMVSVTGRGCFCAAVGNKAAAEAASVSRLRLRPLAAHGSPLQGDEAVGSSSEILNPP